MPQDKSTRGPRERLLRSADRLTYEYGVHVGVDAILTDAGVARRSLYHHFGGKDGLIAAMLHQASQRDLAAYVQALDVGGAEPRDRILALFSALDAVTQAPGFRGCRFIAADLAASDPDHPAHHEVHEHKQALRDLLRRELETGDHPEPDIVADQLLLLVDAVLVSGALRPETQPSRLARPLIEHILNQMPA